MSERRSAEAEKREKREKRDGINDGSSPAQAMDDSAGHSDPSRECHRDTPPLSSSKQGAFTGSCICTIIAHAIFIHLPRFVHYYSESHLRGLRYTLYYYLVMPQHNPESKAESLFTRLQDEHIWESEVYVTLRKETPQTAQFRMSRSKPPHHLHEPTGSDVSIQCQSTSHTECSMR